MSSRSVECHPEIIQTLQSLAQAQFKAESEMRVIFATFALTSGLPVDTRLVGINAENNTLSIEAPETE